MSNVGRMSSGWAPIVPRRKRVPLMDRARDSASEPVSEPAAGSTPADLVATELAAAILVKQ